MEHQLTRPYPSWWLCRCHTFAVNGDIPAVAHRLHAEHIAKEAASPTPANLAHQALVLAGKLRRPKSNVRR
jgi:hypothetical protein